MKLVMFDLDGTLLPIDSDHAFGQFMVRIGWADAEEHGRANDRFFLDYQAGRLDMDAYIDFATAAWRHRPAAEVAAMSARFMHEVIRPAIHEPALQLVRGYQQAGDLVAIVSATNDFITAPIAREFGVEHLIATALERDAEGRPTGRVQGVPSLREGKVTRVRQWLAARGQSLSGFEASLYHGDSTNDLPLLEQVTQPVIVNPGAALEKIAAERGWPVLQLFKQ